MYISCNTARYREVKISLYEYINDTEKTGNSSKIDRAYTGIATSMPKKK